MSGKRKFLVKMLVQEKRDIYHLFPDESCPQEAGSAWLDNSGDKTIMRFQLRQLDGSIFRGIYPTGTRKTGIWSFSKQIEKYLPRDMRIYNESDSVLRLGVGSVADYEYIVFMTHTFDNGIRVVPVVVDRVGMVCWNVCEKFSRFIAEDGLGLFLPDGYSVERDLSLAGLKAVVLDYQSNVRICPVCKHFRDISRPPDRPWITNKWRQCVAKYLS